jgi:hypothetical protein
MVQTADPHNLGEQVHYSLSKKPQVYREAKLARRLMHNVMLRNCKDVESLNRIIWFRWCWQDQIALEYVHSQRETYDHIYWISAVSEGSLLLSFQQIAIRTCCVHQNATLDPKKLVAVVLKKL